jgi:hypothetical protein
MAEDYTEHYGTCLGEGLERLSSVSVDGLGVYCAFCDCAWVKGWSVGVVYLLMTEEYTVHFVTVLGWRVGEVYLLVA